MHQLDMNYMGPMLKTARQKANLTQEKLAAQLGVSTRYIMSIENEGKYPALDLWIRMVRALHISADAIVYPEQMVEQDDSLIRMISMLNDRDRKVIASAVQTMLEQSGDNYQK